MERLEEIWFNHRNKIVVGLILLIGLFMVWGRGYRSKINDDPFMTTAKKTAVSPKKTQSGGAKTICVDIKGAVLHPGVYHLPGGSRVNEALAVAGHETSDADMNQVNLAKQLIDAQVVYIPKKGEQIPSSLSGDSSLTSQGSSSNSSGNQEIINLNTATKEQLCKITGIGDKKADLILQYRQEHGSFNSVDDLKNINGFGEKTVAKLKPMLAV